MQNRAIKKRKLILEKAYTFNSKFLKFGHLKQEPKLSYHKTNLKPQSLPSLYNHKIPLYLLCIKCEIDEQPRKFNAKETVFK